MRLRDLAIVWGLLATLLQGAGGKGGGVQPDGSIFSVHSDGDFDMSNRTVFFRPFQGDRKTSYVYSVLDAPVEKALSPLGVGGDYVRLSLEGGWPKWRRRESPAVTLA
eukprot:evm.model.scf_277.1 EVM.evm.TU.scf_277.1   scf_277:1618-2040(+)